MVVRYLRVALPWLAATCLGGCLQIGIPGVTDGIGAPIPDAGRASDVAVMADGRSADVDAGADLGCIVDPLSHVTLCTSLAICPGVPVDHDRFPNCGFRVGTGVIDIECLCDNYLCPLGSALTCKQARDLLETQFEAVACSQLDEGRCAFRKAPQPAESP
jgi:hypothetical protein